MSLFEIYLDSIKDLLGDRREMKSNIPESVLNNLNYVQNCTFIKVISAEQAINEYRKKVKERESSSTLMNDYSSRSHLVLTLILETENNLTNEVPPLIFRNASPSSRSSTSRALSPLPNQESRANKQKSASPSTPPYPLSKS